MYKQIIHDIYLSIFYNFLFPYLQFLKQTNDTDFFF